MKNLGTTIRERRLELDLGLREMARALEITPSHVCDVEKGSRIPSIELLGKMASVLHFPFQELERLAAQARPVTFRPGDPNYELASKLARGESMEELMHFLKETRRVLPFRQPGYHTGTSRPKLVGI